MVGGGVGGGEGGGVEEEEKEDEDSKSDWRATLIVFMRKTEVRKSLKMNSLNAKHREKLQNGFVRNWGCAISRLPKNKKEKQEIDRERERERERERD